MAQSDQPQERGGATVQLFSDPANVEDLWESHRANPADHRREPACLSCGAPFPCATYDLLTDHANLRAQLAQANAQIARLRERPSVAAEQFQLERDQARAQCETFKKYAHHTKACNKANWPVGPWMERKCVCGLNAALDQHAQPKQEVHS